MPDTRQAIIEHLRKNPVAPGWYWAQHRYWTATKGQWLLIRVSTERHYLGGQRCAYYDECHVTLMDLCDFTDFIRIEEPVPSKPNSQSREPNKQPRVPIDL